MPTQSVDLATIPKSRGVCTVLIPGQPSGLEKPEVALRVVVMVVGTGRKMLGAEPPGLGQGVETELSPNAGGRPGMWGCRAEP